MNFSQIIRSVLDYLLIIPISLMPQHFLSKQIYRLTRLESVRFKHLLIKGFCKVYPIKMQEAERSNSRDYQTFNDFFTRSLKADARIIGHEQLTSPVDGSISQFGDIKVDLLYQAKNFYFSLDDLLGGNDELAREFISGQFATIYLAPKDYHRIHIPCDAKLLNTAYIPGKLFPVNASSVRTVSNIFARNERLVCEFKTEHGKMVLIMVGAIFVGSIQTVWQGEVTPPYLSRQMVSHYEDNSQEISFKKGEEIGRFNMGSTVILLLSENFAKLDLAPEQTLKFGEAITNI